MNAAHDRVKEERFIIYILQIDIDKFYLISGVRLKAFKTFILLDRSYIEGGALLHKRLD